jgi:uncharacterized membrane protein
MYLGIVISAAAVMVLAELAAFFKKREWKVCVIYTVLLLFLLAAAVCIEFGVTLPNPLDPVERIIRAVMGHDKSG